MSLPIACRRSVTLAPALQAPVARSAACRDAFDVRLTKAPTLGSQVLRFGETGFEKIPRAFRADANCEACAR